MSHPILSAKAFELLDGLAANNNRAWFTPRKQQFKEHLQEPFAEILEAASAKLKRVKLPMSGGKHTMFRIYRDVRFSKDKRPYIENISGMLTVSGEKNEHDGLVYVHLDSSGGFVASGFYRLESQLLSAIRQSIVDRRPEFTRAIKKLSRSGLEFSREDSLKRMPRGFEDYLDDPLAEYLKLKSFIIKSPLERQHWLDGSIVDEIVRMNKASTELTLFGLQATGSLKAAKRKRV